MIERIDVTDSAMIRAVADSYREQPIDVLINDAANVEATFAADLEEVNTPYDQIDFDAARWPRTTRRARRRSTSRWCCCRSRWRKECSSGRSSPVLVATTSDMKDAARASPVSIDVAKLVRHSDAPTAEQAGKIVVTVSGWRRGEN